MSTPNETTMADLAAVLLETRRVFNWPEVDERGFFWFFEDRSVDGHEHIGLWIDKSIVVFKRNSFFDGYEGSCPVSMFNDKPAREGGNIGSAIIVEKLKRKIIELHDKAMLMLFDI